MNETYELIHIYVGYSQIKSTAPHPFWVEGKGWVEAGNLLEGDKVKLYSGEVLEIKEIRRERLEEPVKTYNFEVEDWHTYLVSENNVLVHNAGSKKCPLKFSFKSNKSNAGNNNVKSKLRDSRTINFSQKSIDSKFSDGTNIKDTIYRLKNDPSYAEKMEPIRIVKYKDLPADVQQKLASQNVGKHTVFTLDNRRLYAARKAKVKVNTRWATPEEIQNFATVKRFTTINGGKMPEVRW